MAHDLWRTLRRKLSRRRQTRRAARYAQAPNTRAALAELPCDVGDYTYGVPRVRWWGEPARLRIGKFCSIADDVRIFLGGNHRVDWVSTYPFTAFADRWPKAQDIQGHPTTGGDVTIGNDVWIASTVLILSGVTIGDGAAIGSGAVVTRDVEPYSIVVGNPAREIAKRFDDDTIQFLLELRWWDWPEEKIRRHVDILCSTDIVRLRRLA